MGKEQEKKEQGTRQEEEKEQVRLGQRKKR